MPRQKVQLKRIENKAAKQVTFSKRRKGLFKKANELSIMCAAEVGVIVVSEAKRVTHFANPSMDEIIERWKTHDPDKIQALENPPLDLNLEEKIKRLRIKCAEEELKISQMEGKELGNLSMEQLNLLEETMQTGLNRMKAKEREHYEKTIAELQHTIHLKEEELQQKKLRVENVVHQERPLSSESVLTPNANREDALDLCLRLGL